VSPADLVVKGGLVLTEAGRPALERAAVVLAGGRIRRIASWAELSPAEAEAPTLSGADRLVMPGLVNGHTHLAMILFRGLADDRPLMDWLEKHIWPAEAALVSEEMNYWCSLLALAEMIRSGTTLLADGYFAELGALRAVQEAGPRAILAQGIIDFPAPGVPDPGKNLEAARAFLEAGSGLPERIRLGLFCHAPYTCGPQTLRGAKELAGRFGVKCFIHLAETRAEAALIQERYGRRPADYLDRAGFLDRETIAVHGVHLDDGEIDLLARRGAALIACPESNMKLASGRPRVERWLAAGLRVGLGTDGAASNNDLNLFGEMGSLARWAKLSLNDPTALPAERVLDLATRSGAQALGFDGPGRLEAGAPADLISLDLNQVNLLPLHRPASHLVYAAQGSEVREVVVDGRVLLENGELKTIDLARVRAEVARLARKLA